MAREHFRLQRMEMSIMATFRTMKWRDKARWNTARMEACTLDNGKIPCEMDMVFGYLRKERRFMKDSFYKMHPCEDTSSMCSTSRPLLKYKTGGKVLLYIMIPTCYRDNTTSFTPS